MTDRMRTLPFEELLGWILAELEDRKAVFGIPRDVFFAPHEDAPYTSTLFGHHLATPIGPAAGPHTQLAQNILAAWLCGGRFIELKTVQIMDELEIPRPCIDMEDEGYNVEWSQELRLHESLDEYVKAWVLVHVLRRVLGFEETRFGTIFNMSIGYNLEGILSTPMQRFMEQLEDAATELEILRAVLRERFPRYADVEIPARIVDSVTLSTMHGCPPDEIEQIARYLIEERGLHTTVKLNPTLLGKETVLHILHENLGYRSIDIPDSVFEHDLQYDRALELIRSLRSAAAEQGLTFSVKLTNTLATANHRGVLPGEEMYLSGRALYPISINLFHRLIEDLDGNLNVSYSAGADALNLTDILSAGALPVTVASDLLKPGGYARLAQYLERVELEIGERGATDLKGLASTRRERLAEIARAAPDDPRYKKAYHPHGLPKVESKLELLDCIEAPCVARCAVCQDVPEYAHWLACGEDDRALATILHRNPLPGVTGYVCTHLCQTRCTRNAYDEPVAIRRLKRFAVEHGTISLPIAPQTDRRVAVVGSGPSGLAAAYFLAQSGIRVTVFEAKDRAGGMLAIAPAFRLPEAIVHADIARIERLGVTIECDSPVAASPGDLLAEGFDAVEGAFDAVEGGFDAVYVACGFSKDAGLAINGTEADGVYGALEFLDRVAHGNPPELGGRVVVIGGGNTAMDAARTARRLTGRPATVVYRRSRAEMPAEPDEIDDLLAEGNELLKLASPVRVRAEDGRVVGLDCVHNELGEPDEDGRRRPIPISGSEFQLPASVILLATGQQPDIAFLDGSSVVVDEGGRIRVDASTGQTATERVYAGGDITRGPAIIIEACADGRRAAEAICERLGVPFAVAATPHRTVSEENVRRLKAVRARKSLQQRPEFLPVKQRSGFDLVEATLVESSVRAEAERCLQCQILCDRCVDVCPNRANVAIRVPVVDVRLPVLVARGGKLETVREERVTIAQERQILHVDDLCNECGNCATFCTHDGKPYLDKPRLFLRRKDYATEADNALFVEEGAIHRRENGHETRLERTASGFVYDTPAVRVRLTPDFTVEETEAKAPVDGPISLRSAVVMAVLFAGITETAAYLPIATRLDGGTA
jgi:putative selenate reductase